MKVFFERRNGRGNWNVDQQRSGKNKKVWKPVFVGESLRFFLGYEL